MVGPPKGERKKGVIFWRICANIQKSFGPIRENDLIKSRAMRSSACCIYILSFFFDPNKVWMLRLTPDKSRNRPFKVRFHFSDYGVNRACACRLKQRGSAHRCASLLVPSFHVDADNEQPQHQGPATISLPPVPVLFRV
jgi:hypothetical protein